MTICMLMGHTWADRTNSSQAMSIIAHCHDFNAACMQLFHRAQSLLRRPVPEDEL